MATLTEEEFSKHVGTGYQVKLEPQNIELKLIEVKAYRPGENEQPGMERFSAIFEGPAGIHLPQSLYSLTHEAMGEFEIFLVPIAKVENAFRFEAVFNYYKSN